MDIAAILKKEAESAGYGVIRRQEGVVNSVGDGIASVGGLYGAGLYELLEFPGGVRGIAFDLGPDEIKVVLVESQEAVSTGDPAWLTGRTLSMPVGDGLIGRVVNPLGRPLDGRQQPASSSYYPLERPAPGIVKRDFVSMPVSTGIRAIDAMVPIGRGQRELILGDAATGKTAIALDTIANQKEGDMVCVYVAIGQKLSNTQRVVAALRRHGAMAHTVVVCAPADSPLGLQYIAPYAGTAVAEYFFDQGRDALVVYDDLTRHAEAYRSLSLLLRRPPGREAFPGDIFFLHSRLLERSAKLSGKYGGASITALPIVETQSGRISSYIPTNLISICDGQIYMDSEQFDRGMHPAIDLRLSVSRVGGKAQLSAMRDVAGRLKIEYEHFLEVEVFTKFGARLDKETVAKLRRGERLRELLRQGRFEPMSPEDQVCVFYAHGQGYFDGMEMEDMWSVSGAYLEELHASHGGLMDEISSGGRLSASVRTRLDGVIKHVLRSQEGQVEGQQGTGEEEGELPLGPGDSEGDEGALGGERP